MHVPMVKDTVAAVIGENWVRGGASLDSTMVFVYVGTGTGVGVSVNGEPVLGFSGNAGEVGRLLVALGPQGGAGLDNDPMVLVERAHRDGALPGAAPDRRDLTDMEADFHMLCALALDGQPVASELLMSAAERLAAMTVIATELVDADTVVFGGPYWAPVRSLYEPVVREAVGTTELPVWMALPCARRSTARRPAARKACSCCPRRWGRTWARWVRPPSCWTRGTSPELPACSLRSSAPPSAACDAGARFVELSP